MQRKSGEDLLSLEASSPQENQKCQGPGCSIGKELGPNLGSSLFSLILFSLLYKSTIRKSMFVLANDFISVLLQVNVSLFFPRLQVFSFVFSFLMLYRILF